MIDAQDSLDQTNLVLDLNANSNSNVTLDSNLAKMTSVFCTSENSEIRKYCVRADDITDFEKPRSYISPVNLNSDCNNYQKSEYFSKNKELGIHQIQSADEIQIINNTMKTKIAYNTNNDVLSCDNITHLKDEFNVNKFVSNLSSISNISNLTNIVGKRILHSILPSITPVSTVQSNCSLLHDITRNNYDCDVIDDSFSYETSKNNNHSHYHNYCNANSNCNNNNDTDNNGDNNSINLLLERDEDDYSIIDNISEDFSPEKYEFKNENGNKNRCFSVNPMNNFPINKPEQMSRTKIQNNFLERKDSGIELICNKQIYSENEFEINFYKETNNDFDNKKFLQFNMTEEEKKRNIHFKKGMSESSDIHYNLNYRDCEDDIHEKKKSSQIGDKWKEGQVDGLSKARLETMRCISSSSSSLPSSSFSSFPSLLPSSLLDSPSSPPLQMPLKPSNIILPNPPSSSSS